MIWSEEGEEDQQLCAMTIQSQNINGLLKITKKENSKPVQPTDKVH